MTAQRARDRLVSILARTGITNTHVLEVMRYTPRHIFIDEALASHAYDNTALPIGRRQTISQPYVVARMSEALWRDGIQSVLEIGTGCGYQTAVLAQLAAKVYTIERIESLGKQAQKRLTELALDNVEFRYGDGYFGWPEAAPFDAIIVTAAPPEIPPALLEQLAIGARLVIPVGQHMQSLLRITRQHRGYAQERLDDVSFVPLKPGVE
jgi:protein-L-isoaspartate(D-aspartate) O-methyltransferase